MRFTTALAAIAIATLPVAAYAEDRKGEAADSSIPAPVVSVTKHKGSFGGQAIAYTATSGETYLADKDDKPLAAIFSHRLCQGRRRSEDAADHLPVQRRARIGIALAAHGGLRPEARGDPQREGRRRAALPAGRQSRQPARRDRHRLHRSGRHRILPRARQEGGEGLLGPSRPMRSRSRSSSGSGSTATAAGTRPNIWAAKAYGTTRSVAVLNELEGNL